MAKEIKGIVKIQIEAGKANPAPPVGTALGPMGINIMDFCKAFNDQTKNDTGMIIPAEITVYEDRTFVFKLKTPPAAILIKKTLGLTKGSSEPNKKKIAELSNTQLEEIATKKMTDINANDMEAAKRIIAGTARSMGVTVASS